MAKWHGQIGFAETVEVEPGIWDDKIVEHPYIGELNRNSRNLQTSTNVNDNINISNQISIVADPYAREHFFNIRYATFSGAKWKVTNVDVQYPRLILSLGGVYNG